MSKNKIKSKSKKKVSKKPITKKKVKSFKKGITKKISERELIFKTKPEWVKSALTKKTQYQKK